ncbi:MutL, C-terminal, dimerization [Phytophthora cactorum]|nr:MutL, C-terminal, dimerization [Phytophthora cactorum]
MGKRVCSLQNVAYHSQPRSRLQTASAVNEGISSHGIHILIETHRDLLIDFAHLELKRKIRSGNHVATFGGRLRSKKAVAVKVYTPQHFTEEVVGEFSHEAALCASLRHPNVVELSDCVLPSEIPVSSASSSRTGFSKLQPKMTVTGTVEYMAPEMIDSRTGLAAYAEAADVYSLAITFWDILYPHREKYPDTSNNHLLVFESVLSGTRPPIDEHETMNEAVPPRLLDLITSAWKSDPKIRPTARQMVQELENTQGELLATLTQDLLPETAGNVESSVQMFTGEYAVDRMEHLRVIASRSEGIRLGRALMDAGFLHHFEHSCGFRDCDTRIYFLDDDNISFCQPLAFLEESIRDSDDAPRSPPSFHLQSTSSATKLRKRARLLSHLASTFSRSASDISSMSQGQCSCRLLGQLQEIPVTPSSGRHRRRRQRQASTRNSSSSNGRSPVKALSPTRWQRHRRTEQENSLRSKLLDDDQDPCIIDIVRDGAEVRNNMALNILDGKTRDLMTASYAIPDLETAVKQGEVTVVQPLMMVRMVLVENCLSMSDEYFIGDGVQPDDLYEYIGECYASSRVPPKSSRNEQKPPKKYGSRGAFLQELTTLSAAVEIESRVQEHWTSYRKVFKEGRVVFNARSKQLREAPGTKIAVANLFEKLPVRRKDLSRNRKYRSRVIQNVHNFCVSMSMIWPSLSFDIRYEATPIFVLKIAAPSDHYDVSPVGQKGEVLFKNPEQLHQFLFEFVEVRIYGRKSLFCVRYRHFVTCSCCSGLQDRPPTSNYIGDPAAVPLVHDPDEDVVPRYLVTASQGWRNEEIPLSSQRYNYIQVDDSDCGFIAEDDEQLSRESESHSGWSSAFGEHNVLVEQQQSESHLVGNLIRCRACGHFSDIRTSVQADPDSEVNFRVDSGATGSLVSEPSDSQSADVACEGLAQEDDDVGRAERCLEDVFFAKRPHRLVMKQKYRQMLSKPDTFDCADVMLDLCQEQFHNEDDHHDKDYSDDERDNPIQSADIPRRRDSDARSPHDTPMFATPSTKSDYFALGTVERQANSFLSNWINSKITPVKNFAGALRIDSVHVVKGDREIKISKSTLAKLQVIRQVDRKFILVRADTLRGKLVLCIDQHAADERVRLEQLEEEMFGRDGSLRRVEIQEHEPPLVLRMNFKEREVEKKAANADDFRDFIQFLSRTGKSYPHSRIRPPVITRLLHSRACRSAIMFGDHLSLGQCRDLIEDLKTCQLPFQCAHGRPSVVPLAEIHNADLK